MDILSFSAMTMAAVPVIIGLSAVLRSMGLPAKYSPVTDLVFGVFVIMLIGGSTWQADILQGLLAGLSAAGLYNGSQVVAGALVKSVPQQLG